MIYAFADYSLDPDRRELRRSGEIVAVEPQVFDILAFLIRNRERIVSKNELLSAVWGRRVVSDSTITSRMTFVRHAIGDDRKNRRLIQTLPSRGFRFVAPVEERHHAVSAADPAGDRKPAIAVLPFAGEPGSGLDDLTYGIVEDIISGLSQYRWLSVMARSLSCAHAGWAVDIKQVGRNLGTHYVLEGSVRKIEGRLRVTSRLIDIFDGTQLWADRFDLPRSGFLANQDRVTANVVGMIGSKLEQIEINRARRHSRDDLTANQYYWRGMGHLYQWNKDGIDDALGLFRKAIETDPEYAPAYGMAAYCYVQRQSNGWLSSPEENKECAVLAQRAAALAVDDAVTLSKAAHAISSVVSDLDGGMHMIERALKLSPNLAAARYVSAWIRLFRGDSKVAIEDAARAIKLNPFDPIAFKMQIALAYAHFFQGRYDEAAAISLDVVRARPSYLTAMRCAAASDALAGRRDLARRLLADMRNHDPALRLSNLSTLLPFSRDRDFARWAEGLQAAGLPD